MGTFTSRRDLLKVLSAATLAPMALQGRAEAQADKKPWWLGNGMPQEGPDTPKIADGISIRDIDDQTIRNVVQIGVYHVLSGGPSELPWTVEQLQPIVDKLKAGGVSLGNLMIASFDKTLYGLPGRDDEIEKVKASLEAAGKVGLPVVEYNFYAHRATEGYFAGDRARGGAGLTGSDFDRMKDLPPLPQEGTHNLDEMWANITYFPEEPGFRWLRRLMFAWRCIPTTRLLR